MKDLVNNVRKVLDIQMACGKPLEVLQPAIQRHSRVGAIRFRLAKASRHRFIPRFRPLRLYSPDLGLRQY